MDLHEFSTPLPNGITVHHLELHNLSVREQRPIIEFECTGDDDEHEFVLTVFGRERAGLLADLTDYLESIALGVKQANIYSFPNGAVMDQFTLADPNRLLLDDEMLVSIHDTLAKLIGNDGASLSRRARLRMHFDNHSPQAKDSLYNYALLRHRVPITLLAPRFAPRASIVRRTWSNIALTEMVEEQRQEFERQHRNSEALTADFVQHALSSLEEGEFLYHYSSDTRYRHKFNISDDHRYLCWGDSCAARLSRYAGVLFGPKSAVFQDLGPRLVDPEWLCFSLVSNPTTHSATSVDTIDLVCVSVDQLNRWLLALQSLCNPDNRQLLHRLTLDDITRFRVIYKIRAHAHARGLTVRRYILKRVAEAGKRRSSADANRAQLDEVNQLEAELARLQKTLIDYARRETMLNTSLKDFQVSWEVNVNDVELVHPIGHGAFSEMWKGLWRSTPVAVKKLTTRTIKGDVLQNDQTLDDLPFERRTPSALEPVGFSPEDREMLRDFRLEVSMLNKVRHPNIVLFLGACTVPPQLCILTEFCHGGSLFAALRKRSWRQCLSLQDLRSVARYIARGMRYLHACHIIHRDLKSQNLLLDRPVEDGCPVVKVADFGLSRQFRGIGTVTGSVAGIMTSETGTYRWMAPEMIRHEPYNDKVDVYSFGVVLWELFSCEIPFAGMTPVQAAFAVADKHLRPKAESEYARRVKIPAAWEALIERCWHRDTHERPRFSEVLRVLDEMESCSEEEVPRSLIRETEARRNDLRKGAEGLHVGFEVNRYEVRTLGEDAEGRSKSADAELGRTGLQHSGSAPNLAHMESHRL
ncbi:Serine/threonine-protein kinase [Gracilaria domingensis]|nr:Serine/threonine-protein kinase [Gracilaria domingensis]